VGNFINWRVEGKHLNLVAGIQKICRLIEDESVRDLWEGLEKSDKGYDPYLYSLMNVYFMIVCK